MATSTVIFVPKYAAFTWHNPPEQNYVDRYVFAKLRLLHMEPSPLTSDEAFFRRVYLDSIGRLPTPEQARSFLSDLSPGNRDKLINGLVASPELADWRRR